MATDRRAGADTFVRDRFFARLDRFDKIGDVIFPNPV